MKLNLNETWKKCLEMWSGVIKILDYCKLKNIDIEPYEAKVLWLELNGYEEYGLVLNCFFCQYAVNHGGHFDYPSGEEESENITTCSKCPATLVDPDFYCEGSEIHWCELPYEFYDELVRLNKIRTKKNKKKGN